MKKGFSLVEILVALTLATIVLGGIFFVFNQAFKSVDMQLASLKVAMKELNTSINAWKGDAPTDVQMIDITNSTLPATFSDLEEYMKIYRIIDKNPLGTLTYRIIVISK